MQNWHRSMKVEVDIQRGVDNERGGVDRCPQETARDQGENFRRLSWWDESGYVRCVLTWRCPLRWDFTATQISTTRWWVARVDWLGAIRTLYTIQCLMDINIRISHQVNTTVHMPTLSNDYHVWSSKTRSIVEYAYSYHDIYTHTLEEYVYMYA